MSTLEIDNTLTAPPPHSQPVRSVSDVARLINSNTEKTAMRAGLFSWRWAACFLMPTISLPSPTALMMW